MLIDHIEKLKEWLTTSLTPICEADPGEVAKYVVALVKKAKSIAELQKSCVDKLAIFLQTETKLFVDALFDVLENKSYFTEDDIKPAQVEPDSQTILPDETPAHPVPTHPLPTHPPPTQPGPTPSDTQIKADKKPSAEAISASEDNKDVPNEPRRRRTRSRSRSPRFYRGRDIDERRRRYDERDRRPYDRGLPRRKSNSPIPVKQRLGPRPRSRSPNRRRSPYRPSLRMRSPRPRGRGRPFSRSRSRSRSPRRSWSRSRSRERFRSRSKSPYRARSKSPRRLVIRPRSPRPRSRSPRPRSKSPINRSRSPGRKSPLRRGSRSPGRISRSPLRRLSRSPIRLSGSPIRRSSKSPLRRSRSPLKRSRSPMRRSRSLGRRLSRSPLRRSLSPDSRSPVRFSRSRSLTRSRSGSPLRKVRRQSSESRGPTPTQENGLADSTNPTPTASLSSISVVTSSHRTRCRDFDEKGFCVRGDLCMYDHGTDPVVVENVPPRYPPQGPAGAGMPPIVGAPPGFNVRVPPPGFMNRLAGPPPHMLRPPRPEFQEYNPEAPGIGVAAPPMFWPGGPRGPPPGFLAIPPPRPPPTEPPRTRDLVNLTTVSREPQHCDEADNDEEVPTSSSRTVIAPKEETASPAPPGTLPDNNPSQPAPVPVPAHIPSRPPAQPVFTLQQRYHPYQRFPGPRKPFDYNRVGGFRRPDMTNCTLEVRKIPQEMNNIAKLNEHFGTFGALKNIEVSYDGDPEAALITYRTNFEANKCYKSSEPVFNNRFIKLFWHRKPDVAGTQEQAPSSTTTAGVPSSVQPDPDSSRQPAQARLGPIPPTGPPTIPPASKLSLNNMKKSTPTAQPTGTADKQVAYTSSMGSVSKTVYNPAAMQKPKPPLSSNLVSPTAVHAADFISRIEAVKKLDAAKQEAVQKSLEIQKHKRLLLEKQIEQQKLLITRLDKNKATMKGEEKNSFMTTLKSLTDSIEKLKGELGVRKVVMKRQTSAEVKSPEQAKKEILDVELELMTKTTSGEDTADLKRKLNELTKLANSMGLLGRGRGRGSVARGRAATTWVAAGIAAPAPVIGRGRGALLGKAAVASRTLDRRPRVIEVTGFTAEEKDDMVAHLDNMREVEKTEFNMSPVPSAIVAFKTRHDAEMGMLYGSKFKTKTLKLVWHIAKPVFTRSSSTVSGDNDDADAELNLDEIDEEALLAGEDEDEESDSERSWKH